MRVGLEVLANKGYVSQALEFARRISSPTVAERVILCELEALSANRETAMELAVSIVASSAPADSMVRALLVAGRIDFYKGKPAEAQQRFANAQELASQHPDPALTSLAIGTYIEALFRHVSYEAGVSHLNQYRRAAVRAGTPLSLLTLHRVLAEAELKSGRSHRALNELQLARTYVSAIDNLCSEAQLELTHSATYWATRRYVDRS